MNAQRKPKRRWGIALLLDRFGPTRLERWSALLWGVACSLTALAGGPGGLIAAGRTDARTRR